MNAKERDDVFRSALAACKQRRFTVAGSRIRLLVADGSKDPHHLSFYGLMLVRGQGSNREGIEYCRKAVTLNPGEAQLHLNLSRAYRASGQLMRAVQVLRQGLRTCSSHDRTLRALRKELDRLSPRRDPVLGSLGRDHVLNKYLGRFRARSRRAG